MSVLRVLHLVGSAVSDFYCDLSRLYAQDCLENTANSALYEFHIAYVSPDRTWRFPTSLDKSAIEAAHPMSLAGAVQVLTDLQIDVMIPQMFCIPGMTQYRSLFDLLNIPYVGNPAELMALVADKARTKAVVAAAGVSVPLGEVVRAGDRTLIDFPIVLKPVNSDNSIGVAFVKNAADYDAALQKALTHSDEVLVEKFIELGREVRCGIIVKAGELVCLPLEEYALDADTMPIRSYADKLKQNDDGSLGYAAKDSTKSWIVDISDSATERVWDMARKSHIALGCRHYSLFDFRIDPQGKPWFLEAGLYCSFAQKSVLSAMTKASGTSLDTFFESMLQNALCKIPNN
ncbi:MULTISPECIES: ATP-grasp domain-containing protein [unclassified Microcoleus]|uniref:D-alanine--D-alanine ligase family protein n=1 Tax=unclassified Microcoleus TaxID=2642155 RepID=UPI001D319AE4|nr:MULTISPECIES: ATP-grasp domain-containing protein [unclassified Microcoleus]TAE40174.1 MAG: ATP-grasp domain-containing protein [Oscillatoriales cyanobacterium]MCC3415475.1 ATP-grasp domain-containing protein [Microcoleus sp. PH2017_02_FOX_O_A]MCC3426845.1 ATP-grasp domain-containing protein [Microcoleus sp. PH2017_01_SCD_O_A]MCC3493419.1 ATP-grasp domain-containing protein [Microcoleus sp. PH2017_16_JOR_D_A]MCC3500216.1 ATP-grasp domain-containing protein [Microcoleus sp. PH2017_15_JOR_U_A